MSRPHPLVAKLAEEQDTLDLSNMDVSRLTGVNEKTLRYLKTGQRDPMVETLEQIAWGMGFLLTLTYVGVKECTGCGEYKALAEFGRDRETPDGVSRRCKTCKNAQCNRNRKARAAA